MSMFSSIKKKIASTIKIKKRVFDPEMMSAEDIVLPRIFNIVHIDGVRSFVKEELGTYKSLGYKDMPIEQLKVLEYHSYQIGMMIKAIKDDVVNIIPDVSAVLPSISTYITKRQLHMKVFEIVNRYESNVEKDELKEQLRNDLIWTPLDMAYLLYYLSLEDRVIPKKK
jgi:hypothetical protein